MDARQQQRFNNLVELAFLWAEIEQELRVLRPEIAGLVSKAARVVVIEPKNGSEPPWYQLRFRSHDWRYADGLMNEEARNALNSTAAKNLEASQANTWMAAVGFGLVDPDPSLPKHLATVSRSIEDSLHVQICRRPESERPQPRIPKVRRHGVSLTPIEARFHDELRETAFVFAAQPPVFGTDREYRPDFLVFYRGGAIIVEIDGHESHASKAQRQRDARRDLWFQQRGFRTVRFTGSDVHADARGCVAELNRLIRSLEHTS